MKHRIKPTTLAIVFVGLLVLSIAPNVQAGDIEGKPCSNASAAGFWGFTLKGDIVRFGPVAAVGIFTLDADGKAVGAQTRSFNGSIAKEAFTGTVTVNPDCTGTASFTVQPSGRMSHFDFVILDNGNESHAIQTDPGTVITTVDKRIFPGRGKQD